MNLLSPVLLFVILFFSCEGEYSYAQNVKNEIEKPSLCTDTLRICYNTNDTITFNECWALAQKDSFADKPISVIIEKLAQHFIGVPYGSPARKGAKQNKLVIGLERFDCVTFVESIFALSRCIKNQKKMFCDFAEELAGIRYRTGKIRSYTSRLHYFSEWIYDNESRKMLCDVSGVIDTIPFNKKINYMTVNKRKYRTLKNKNICAEMCNIEKQLSARKRYYLPKNNFDEYKPEIQNGDIITFTTSTTGLDVSHTGFAIWVNNDLYLLHASSQFHKVMISKIPLKEYLFAKKKNTGILVARPL